MYLCPLHISAQNSNISICKVLWMVFFERVRKIAKSDYYRSADKSLARPGRKQGNVSVRMAWISFGTLPCRKKKIWWQLASRCCWNRADPWHDSELVTFLGGLRTYQHPGSFVMSACPSVCLHGTTRFTVDPGFSWNSILEIFSKIYRENSSFAEMWQS